MEELEPGGDGGAHELEDRFEIPDRQRSRALHRAERAVAPQDRRLAFFEVHVGRAELDGTPQKGVEVHETLFGRRRAGLEPG